VRYIYLISFFIYYLSAYSQTGNNTFIPNGGILSYDEDFQPIFNEYSEDGYGHISISDYSGKLQYNIGYKIQNADGEEIIDESAYLYNRASSTVVILSDSVHLVFDAHVTGYKNGKPVTPIKHSILRKRNGQYTLDPSEYLKDFIPDDIISMAPAIEDTAGGTWLVVKLSSTLFRSYKFTTSEVPDTMVETIIPEMYSAIAEIDSGRVGQSTNGIWKAHRSPSGNLLVFGINEINQLPAAPNEDWDKAHILGFNKMTGKLTFKAEAYNYHDTAQYDQINSIGRDRFRTIFSSDDKSMYYKYIWNSRQFSLVKLNKYNLSTGVDTEFFSDTFTSNYGVVNQYHRGMYDIKLGLNNEILGFGVGKYNFTNEEIYCLIYSI
jgi:hypothetical protein